MGSLFGKIKENTKDMNRKETLQYIVTYYWYHILGVLAVLGLLIFLVVHFAFPEEKPLFKCALINQKIDSDRDAELAEAFSKSSGIDGKRIVFDSDYIISYKQTDEKIDSEIGNEINSTMDNETEENQTAGNESGFDKFFFQWSKGELDAVILTKDFLEYCTSVGGEYYSADEFDTKDLNLCEAGGTKAIELAETKLESELDGLNGTEKEELVLVFPATGNHKEMCQKYIDFLNE